MFHHDGQGLAASLQLTGHIVPKDGKLEREHQMMPNKNPKSHPSVIHFLQRVPTS